MSQVSKFRIVTYNVHKCVGVDRRLDPARIVNVLKEINADIIALQVVLCIHGRNGEDDQAHFIARGLGFNYCMGHNRELKGGVYGNLMLTRSSSITSSARSNRHSGSSVSSPPASEAINSPC